MRTKGSTTIGHARFVSRASPRYAVARPRYMGFRVRRNGPVVTSRRAGLTGSTAVPRRDECESAQPINAEATGDQHRPERRLWRRGPGGVDGEPDLPIKPPRRDPAGNEEEGWRHPDIGASADRQWRMCPLEPASHLTAILVVRLAENRPQVLLLTTDDADDNQRHDEPVVGRTARPYWPGARCRSSRPRSPRTSDCGKSDTALGSPGAWQVPET